jgi:hypothetical protein
MQFESRIYVLDWQGGYLQIWRESEPFPRSAPLVDDGIIGWNHYIGCTGIRLFWFTDSLQPPIPSQFGMFEISFWWILSATLLLPLAWAAKTLARNHKRLAGICTTCGYDLRATPDRCPECGKVVEKII